MTDAILLIHGGVFSDWFTPVAASPQLDDFRIVRTHRAGYAQGTVPSGHLTLADHAADCARLLDELGIETTNVCGHSSGALVALELALLRPDAVNSLVLLEPAPASALIGPQCEAALPGTLGPVMGALGSGDIAAAFDLFLRAVGRQDYRAVLDSALGPGAYERALQESAFFFSDEVPAVQEWTFGPDEAARIAQPMLLVEGSETAAVAAIPPESVGRLKGLVPHAETTVLHGASHLMPLEDPDGVARLIAEFARRP